MVVNRWEKGCSGTNLERTSYEHQLLQKSFTPCQNHDKNVKKGLFDVKEGIMKSKASIRGNWGMGHFQLLYVCCGNSMAQAFIINTNRSLKCCE
jgi:hypothetical protein